MKNLLSIQKQLTPISVFLIVCCFISTSIGNATSNSSSFIDTSIDTLPEIITSSPYTITASGSDNLTNVSLYYKYDLHNSSMHNSGLEVRDVFREGVDSTVFDYPNTIKVVDDVGYAVAYKDNSLVLINVLNPSMLTQLSYKVDPLYLYRVHDVAVSSDGKYAFTITYTISPWICIWNVSNPYEPPIRINQIQIPSNGKGMYLNFDHTGDFLYITTTDYCYIINVSNKATGQLDLLSKFNIGIPATSYRWHTYIVDEALYVFVGNQSSTVPGDGVYVYNISDRTQPILVNDFNHSAMIREFREYYWHGFRYLVGFIQYQKEIGQNGWSQNSYPDDFPEFDRSTYWTAGLGVWNISSGNVTHPDFLCQVNTLESDGTFTSDAFDMHDGYAFAMRKNRNTSTYDGISVYNLKDINDIFKVDHINGTGYPNYLNLCHEVEFNMNGIDGTVYVVSQNSDALTTIYFKPEEQNNSWIRFGIDSSPPWNWSFNFPNGTGYYKFYSIGTRNGESELPPESADAWCFYQPQQIVKSFLFGRITNRYTGNETITFDSVKTWRITFSPLRWYRYSPSERIIIEKKYFGFLGNQFIFTFCNLIYLV